MTKDHTDPGPAPLATPESASAILMVLAERRRQEGYKASGRFRYTAADREMSDLETYAVLGEEVGEAAEAFNLGLLTHRFGEVGRALLEKGRLANDLHGKSLQKELVQVAAVAVAWVEKLIKAAADDIEADANLKANQNK